MIAQFSESRGKENEKLKRELAVLLTHKSSSNAMFVLGFAETKRRCGFFFDVFGLPLPSMENCNLYPDDMKYPDVKCVGHKQVKEEKIRATRKSK